MYNKKNKKHSIPIKKAKFVKKEPVVPIIPIVEPIEEISVIELTTGQNPTPKELLEPPKTEITPIVFQTSEIPEIKIEPKKELKAIKTKIKPKKDKNNKKKAVFKKQEKKIVVPPPIKYETVTKEVILTTTENEEKTIFKCEVPKDETIVVINTPIVEFKPKKDETQITLFNYVFNNFENKNIWSKKLIIENWHKNKHPKLNTWIIDYFHPKNNKKEWFKTLHYFTTSEIDLTPLISPDVNSVDGCE